MNRIKSWYNGLPWDRQILISAGTLSSLLLLITIMVSQGPPKSEGREIASIDTHIPVGFVLLPIEVQNAESLDSILGMKGIVDLFQVDPMKGEKAQKIARNVRLLRAPRNPNHFAILIPESQALPTLRGGGPFWVVVKPPHAGGTEFEKPVHRRIIYDGG